MLLPGAPPFSHRGHSRAGAHREWKHTPQAWGPGPLPVGTGHPLSGLECIASGTSRSGPAPGSAPQHCLSRRSRWHRSAGSAWFPWAQGTADAGPWPAEAQGCPSLGQRPGLCGRRKDTPQTTLEGEAWAWGPGPGDIGHRGGRTPAPGSRGSWQRRGSGLVPQPRAQKRTGCPAVSTQNPRSQDARVEACEGAEGPLPLW